MLPVIETALKWGRPPSAYFQPEQGGGWTAKDYLLTHAHTLYLQGLCPECGRPRDVCRQDGWDVDQRICGPSAAVALYRKEHPKPDPGEVLSTSRSETPEGSDTWASAPAWVREQYGGTSA